jgi:hypothetical protein
MRWRRDGWHLPKSCGHDGVAVRLGCISVKRCMHAVFAGSSCVRLQPHRAWLTLVRFDGNWSTLWWHALAGYCWSRPAPHHRTGSGTLRKSHSTWLIVTWKRWKQIEVNNYRSYYLHHIWIWGLLKEHWISFFKQEHWIQFWQPVEKGRPFL